MNNLIPASIYTNFFFNFLIVILMFIFLHSMVLKGDERKVYLLNKGLGYFLVVFTVLYIGLRPFSWVFGDMLVYAKWFRQYTYGAPLRQTGDIFFHFLMKQCANVMSVELFFLLVAFIYIYFPFMAFKKWFPRYYMFIFFIFITSFSFWSYGTNGIRNGLATSIFIYAVSCFNRKIIMFLWVVVAVLIHKSMMLPASILLITLSKINVKYYFLFWLLSIPLSLALGSFWENFFSGFGFDDRMSYLTNDKFNDSFSSSSFRWDFLLYSFTATYSGYYFVIKKGFQDRVYQMLLGVFLLSNSFWILVIRASFSNRFAYLSWFLLPIIIMYPLLKQQLIEKQFLKIGYILILSFSFTYFMNIVLK